MNSLWKWIVHITRCDNLIFDSQPSPHPGARLFWSCLTSWWLGHVGLTRETPMAGRSSPPTPNHRWSGGTVGHGLHPTVLLHHLSPLSASSHPYLHAQVPLSSLGGCTNNRLSNSHHSLRARYVPDFMLRWRSICLSLCPFTDPSRQTDRQVDR